MMERLQALERLRELPQMVLLVHLAQQVLQGQLEMQEAAEVAEQY
jgi:hypothetical protein